MRYIIGIDLGTTNSCVAYVDTRDDFQRVQAFKIPQLKGEGSIEAMPTLPSFCYLTLPSEWPREAVSLPWASAHTPFPTFITGWFARQQGSKIPTRLVQSAKSWLCHPSANRSGNILPIEAADESIRVSPIEATRRYLQHISQAWDHVMAKGDPEAEFSEQEIILTVPASFDEAARTLTIEAAKRAGYAKMTLIEEPQAAFYSWLSKHEREWESKLPPGTQILVCDVGGGTTDFSMIQVLEREGHVALNRIAVGDHLMLGGDNMDAAAMHWMISELKDDAADLTTTQRLQLLFEARRIKEEALSTEGEATGSCRMVIHGAGSKVIGGAVNLEVDKQALRNLLEEGFFPLISWDEALRLRKASGMRTMGLPYEDDPAITKHLARFLHACKDDAGKALVPDLVLFNGGTMKPESFRRAIMASLRSWFPEKKIDTLSAVNYDLAVALGAAYYGKARRGNGVKIGGGLARGCYLILDTTDKGESSKKALTLMPRGSEEGEVFESSSTFMLTPNVPVSFQLCSSHVRLHDKAGDLVPVLPEEMQMLPPIHTILRYGKKQAFNQSEEKVPVKMRAVLTPVGTIEISLRAIGSENAWTLEFQLKTASGHDDAIASVASAANVGQTFERGFFANAEEAIRDAFGPSATSSAATRLMENLEERLGMPRTEWPSSALRGLFDTLIKVSGARMHSVQLWERWWNLAGFLLRPGFGYPLDDFRIKELWKVVLADSKTQTPQEVKVQVWVAFRRVAGGFSKGQQNQIATDLLATLIGKKGDKIESIAKAELYRYTEKIRAVGALELLDISTKVRLGTALTHRIIDGSAHQADFWSLGRIGARHLAYGSLAHVIPAAVCEGWVGTLLAKIPRNDTTIRLMEQLARKTEHSELNLSKKCVNRVLEYFAGTDNYPRLEELLLHESRLSHKEQDMIFGDHLPSGLLLEVES